MKRMLTIVIAAALALPLLAQRPPRYIYSDGGSSITAGADVDTILAMRARYGGAFLWFRLADGKQYLIRDAATLKQIGALFAPMRALDPQYDALRSRMEPLERRERELDRQQEDVEERIESFEDQELTAAQEAEIARLEERQRELESRMRALEKELRVLEAEERRLDAKQEKLEEEAERAMGPIVERAIRSGVAVRL